MGDQSIAHQLVLGSHLSFSRELKPESIASLDLQPAWERRDGLLLLHGLGMSYLPDSFNYSSFPNGHL